MGYDMFAIARLKLVLRIDSCVRQLTKKAEQGPRRRNRAVRVPAMNAAVTTQKNSGMCPQQVSINVLANIKHTGHNHTKEKLSFPWTAEVFAVS